MRSKPINIFTAAGSWVLAAAAVLVSCEQRPLDLAPETPNLKWATLHELRHLDDFNSVWASSPSDIYIGGAHGMSPLLHFDGTNWEEIQFPNSDYLENIEIWGTGPDDVYVADGALYHYDGVSWVRQPKDADVVGGVGRDDVYAADGRNIYRFNGSYWEQIYEDTVFRDAYSIWAGPGPSLVVVRSKELVHWDGSAWWTTYPGFVLDVWGTATNNLYAVGWDDIYHYDGSDWTRMDVPDEVANLRAIWGTATDDIYAVGEYGHVVHYDGVSWTLQEQITAYTLTDVWGTGASDVYAVGENEKVIHYDGSFWISAREDQPPDPWDGWAISKTELITWSYPRGIHVFDGTGWREECPGTTAPANAFGGTAINDLYVSFNDRTIRHFDGNNWSVSADSLPWGQDAFWTAGPNDIFSVGDNSMYRFDGTNWNPITEDRHFFGTDYFDLLAVWGSSPENVFAVGWTDNGAGMVVRFDGSVWERMEGRFKWRLTSVWGTSEKDVYAVGEDNIYHYDGTRWTEQPHYFWARPRWVTGRGPDLVIAGGGPYLMQYDGTVWNHVRSDSYTDFVFAAYDGSIIRLTDKAISYLEE